MSIKEFIEALIDEEVLEKGNEYYLKIKRTDKEMNPEENFIENKVRNNDTLLAGIKIFAG